MKQIGQVIVIAGAAILGTTGLASAAGINFHVGPGGAYVGVSPRHHHHRILARRPLCLRAGMPLGQQAPLEPPPPYVDRAARTRVRLTELI